MSFRRSLFYGVKSAKLQTPRIILDLDFRKLRPRIKKRGSFLTVARNKWLFVIIAELGNWKRTVIYQTESKRAAVACLQKWMVLKCKNVWCGYKRTKTRLSLESRASTDCTIRAVHFHSLRTWTLGPTALIDGLVKLTQIVTLTPDWF